MHKTIENIEIRGGEREIDWMTKKNVRYFRRNFFICCCYCCCCCWAWKFIYIYFPSVSVIKSTAVVRPLVTQNK